MEQQKGEILKFIQTKDYVFQRYIGSGGTGLTVLLKDEITDFNFVCKKYAPVQKEYRDDFFERFIDEIKIMYPLYNKNVVRIFNYFLYPDYKTGYILMEYIQGTLINEYLLFESDEVVENIFIQLIEGFAYLESKSVLHRDIKNNNVMVTEDGIVKIIDFGFGKKISDNNVEASLILNWPVSELPSEIKEHVYNHRTEVYFVGKLFDKLLKDTLVLNFKYIHIIEKMIKVNVEERIESFAKILQNLSKERIREKPFSEDEKRIYRKFANELISIISMIKNELEQIEDPQIVLDKMTNVLDVSSLEEFLQQNSKLISCFISGSYTYSQKTSIKIENINDFYRFFSNISEEKQKIVLSNLGLRLSTIKIKYEGDDIPF